MLLKIFHRLCLWQWWDVGKLPDLRKTLFFEWGVDDFRDWESQQLCILLEKPIWNLIWAARLRGVQCGHQFHYLQLGYLTQLRRVSVCRELGQRLFQAIFFKLFKESLVDDICKFLVVTSSRSSMWMWLVTLLELEWDPHKRLTSFHHSWGFHPSCARLWFYKRRPWMIFFHDLLRSCRTYNWTIPHHVHERLYVCCYVWNHILWIKENKKSLFLCFFWILYQCQDTVAWFS